MSTELMAKLRAVFSLPSGAVTFKSLEEHVRRAGAEVVQELFAMLLVMLDNELLESRPEGWVCKDRPEKTYETVIGPVRVKRRRYLDERKRSRYLLDERLGFAKRQRISPGLMCEIVKQSTEVSFRQAAQHRKDLGLTPVSHATIHRWEVELGARRSSEESADQEAVFGYGQVPASTKERVDTLFVEADGVMVHAQREEVERFEIKMSLVHKGWVPRYPGSTEWALEGRHVHAGVIENDERYWEQALVSHQKRYDVFGAARSVLNGDGAEWIDGGREYLPCCHRQLDRFHVYRDIRRAYPDEEANGFIRQLARGNVDAVLDTMEACATATNLPAKTRERRLKLWQFMKKRQKQLHDYRSVFQNELSAEKVWRGPGAAEGCVDKQLAHRLKKVGRCWTRKGADAMARLRALRANGELDGWLERQVSTPSTPHHQIRKQISKRFQSSITSEWLNKQLPALSGPHPTRPWAKALREIAFGNPLSA